MDFQTALNNLKKEKEIPESLIYEICYLSNDELTNEYYKFNERITALGFDFLVVVEGLVKSKKIDIEIGERFTQTMLEIQENMMECEEQCRLLDVLVEKHNEKYEQFLELQRITKKQKLEKLNAEREAKKQAKLLEIERIHKEMRLARAKREASRKASESIVDCPSPIENDEEQTLLIEDGDRKMRRRSRSIGGAVKKIVPYYLPCIPEVREHWVWKLDDEIKKEVEEPEPQVFENPVKVEIMEEEEIVDVKPNISLIPDEFADYEEAYELFQKKDGPPNLIDERIMGTCALCGCGVNYSRAVSLKAEDIEAKRVYFNFAWGERIVERVKEIVNPVICSKHFCNGHLPLLLKTEERDFYESFINDHLYMSMQTDGFYNSLLDRVNVRCRKCQRLVRICFIIKHAIKHAGVLDIRAGLCAAHENHMKTPYVHLETLETLKSCRDCCYMYQKKTKEQEAASMLECFPFYKTTVVEPSHGNFELSIKKPPYKKMNLNKLLLEHRFTLMPTITLEELYGIEISKQNFIFFKDEVADDDHQPTSTLMPFPKLNKNRAKKQSSHYSPKGSAKRKRDPKIDEPPMKKEPVEIVRDLDWISDEEPLIEDDDDVNDVDYVPPEEDEEDDDIDEYTPEVLDKEEFYIMRKRTGKEETELRERLTQKFTTNPHPTVAEIIEISKAEDFDYTTIVNFFEKLRENRDMICEPGDPCNRIQEYLEQDSIYRCRAKESIEKDVSPEVKKKIFEMRDDLNSIFPRKKTGMYHAIADALNIASSTVRYIVSRSRAKRRKSVEHRQHILDEFAKAHEGVQPAEIRTMPVAFRAHNSMCYSRLPKNVVAKLEKLAKELNVKGEKAIISWFGRRRKKVYLHDAKISVRFESSDFVRSCEFQKVEQRHTFTREEKERLMEFFKKTPYPTSDGYKNIAKELKLTAGNVYSFFDTQRQIVRKEKEAAVVEKELENLSDEATARLVQVFETGVRVKCRERVQLASELKISYQAVGLWLDRKTEEKRTKKGEYGGKSTRKRRREESESEDESDWSDDDDDDDQDEVYIDGNGDVQLRCLSLIAENALQMLKNTTTTTKNTNTNNNDEAVAKP
ncbi:unnamed protein product [Caenorhabditis bovis]|uniref:Homeobox domain-containing protein n=1 Tax=Caenorhabditis bovis TaxID=2654633 RepID=A0A8S1EQ38_9PELO|nr:unnamed protein product [Caenorhabditis bovis]